MLKWSNFPIATILLLIVSASLSAQNAQPKQSAEDKLQTRQVIASVAGESIRFSSLGELIQMRLEVIGSTGEVLFDSDFKSGNLIEWPLSDKQGQRLVDGSYLCVVAVKDPSGLIARKHAIATLRDQSLGLRQSDSSLLSAPQAQVAGPLPDGDLGLTIIEPEQSSATAILAHDGSTAYLVSGTGGFSISSGDFFANKVLQHMRLTPQGYLGIGTSNPQARLDVEGMIRASQGIIFPDGSIQLSAARKTLGASSLSPTERGGKPGRNQDTFQTQVAGTGTTNKIAKWTDNVGTLGNSTIFEAPGGSIGIGTTAPGGVFDLQSSSSSDILQRFWNTGSAGAKLRYVSAVGATSQIQLTDLNEWLMSIAGNNQIGMQFRVRAAGDPNNESTLAARPRMTILRNGNVGIGTTAPNSGLDVVNTTSQIHFTDTLTESGGYLVSDLGSATLSSGARWNGSAWVAVGGSPKSITSMTSGDIRFFTDNVADGATFTPTERMRIENSGRVGIGTTAPANLLHVVGPGTDSGGRPGFDEVVAHFRQSIATNDSAISIDAPSGESSILYLAEQGVPKWSVRKLGEEFAIRSHDSDGTPHSRVTVEPDGKVGIGTLNPSNRLHVTASADGVCNSCGVAFIENTTAQPSNVLNLRIGTSVPNQSFHFINFLKENPDGDPLIGWINSNQSGDGVKFVSVGGDYAEMLPRLNPDEKIQPGEIVGLYGGQITKNTRGAAQIMAVSANPIVLGNLPAKEARSQYEQVAFIGQVPIRVRGAVKAGDFIVASGLNDGTGVAVSPDCITSEQFEQVVGQAWESSSDDGLKSVQTAVGLIQRDPTVSRLLESSRRQTSQIAELGARLTAIELRLGKKLGAHKTAASRNSTSGIRERRVQSGALGSR